MSVTDAIWLDGGFAVAGLPDPGDLRVATLGWRESEAPVEQGLSAEIALLLARLMLAHGQAMFIDYHLGMGDGARLWRRSAGGLLYSLPGPRTWKYGPRRRALDIMVTRDPAILATLGLGADAWTFQQQVILIVDDHRAAEQMEAHALTGWLGAGSRPDPRSTFRQGVLATLCAGHDGSMAALYAPSRETLAAIGDTLGAICSETGLGCHHAESPREFARLIGYGPRVETS